MAITTVSSHVVSVNAIQGTLIADNAITAVHIATNAVSGTLIADNAVTATHIAQNTITVTQIADDAIEAAKLADGIITTNHLNKAMISSQTEVTAVAGDFLLIGDTSDSNNLKKIPISGITNLVSTALDDITTGDAASTLATSSGSITLDSPADIILDADTDGRVFFFDGGTEYGNVGKSSNSLYLKSAISDGDILFQGNDGGSAITALTLDMSNAGAGNFNSSVGLGITSNFAYPNLSIHNSRAAATAIFITNANNSAGDYNEIKSAYSYSDQSYGSGIRFKQVDTTHGGQMEFFTDNSSGTYTQRMTLDENGNLGVGTSSPGAKLEISGKDDAGAGDLLRLQFDNSPADTGITFTDINSTVKCRLTMDAANTADLRISSASQQHFYGGTSNGTGNGHFMINSSGHVGIVSGKRFYLNNASIQSGDTYIDEYSSNEVGITTGGSRKLAVSGGNLYVSGSVNANHNFSDVRLKDNVVVIPNALQKVSSLRGITFTRKDDGSVGTGLIAQELETVLPEAVYEAKMVEKLENPDAEAWKSINYGNTVGLLVEAIKELKTKLEAAEARIATLEG